MARRPLASAALLAVGVALLAPSSAAAHAFLVSSTPSAGAVLAQPPRVVRLVFDEGVRPAPGMDVVRSGAGSVLAGRPYVPRARPSEIVLPLRRPLARGDYTVRWRELDVDDGHLITGAFAFAVGAGLAPPGSPGSGSSGPSAGALVSRWLLLAGLLAAAGSVGFGLLVSRPVLREGPLAERRRRADALVLAGALALAATGALLSVVLQPGSGATRFGRWTEIGAGLAAAAAAASLASLRLPRLRVPAAAAACALLVLPTATGHALAPGPPHWLSVPADLVHLAAAALWIGGGLGLVLVAPVVLRPATSELRADAYGALARRYSPLALGAVVALGLSGALRAATELRSASQLWSTGYGHALLVKTGILLALVLLGWLNRYRLLPALRGAGARLTGAAALLRRSVAVELALLAVLVGAVAVLTNVRPGRDYPAAAAAATRAASSQTVVLAGQDDDLAVGLALTPSGGSTISLRATVLGFAGPVSGLRMGVPAAGRTVAAAPCGAGCYAVTAPLGHAVAVRIARRGHPTRTLRFALPARWPAPPADAIVRRAGSVIRGLHSLVDRSRLASDARHVVFTTYRIVAPNRLEYRNGDGSGSIIIGDRRWDRSPGGPWQASPQNPPLRQPVPFWPPRFVDAHVLREATLDGRPVWVVSFLDPATPAWFTIWVDRADYRTLRVDMVATAHFMHDREGPFDAPIRIAPPSRR